MPSETPPVTAHITSSQLLIPTMNAWRYYLEDQGNSLNTIKAFMADIHLLAAYLPPDRTLGAITTTDLNGFLDWMQTRRGVPCSPKTLARRITTLKSFFRWLHQNGVLVIDPAEKVVQKSVISPLPAILTPDETQRFLEAAGKHRQLQRPDTRPYVLALLLLETGIKKGECLALHLNHIDLDAPNEPLLFIRYASPQHRYKERKLALSPAWLEVFHEYKAQYGITDRIFPWSPRRLEYLLEDLSQEAALDKHVSFDMCRWTCAVNDWRANMDHNQIRQKLGISKIQWREISMKLEKLA